MIKFFRNIRRNLLGEGKNGKYFRYAIGEILLVTIGILLALQVNNWNENQKSQKSEKIYLNRLVDDVKSDTLLLSQLINDAHVKSTKCKNIKAILDSPTLLRDTTQFVIDLQAVGRLVLPSISMNTFDDLKNTGNLKLIKDQNLTSSIRNYYNSVPNWWFSQYSHQLVEGYLPIAVDAIPIEIHEEIINKELNAPNAIAVYLGNDIASIRSNDFLIIYRYLKEHPEYEFHLKRITRSHLVHAKLLVGLKDRAIELLAELNEELNQ